MQEENNEEVGVSDAEKLGFFISQYLGHEVEDKITGFKGTTVQVCFSLNSVPSLQVQPRMINNEKYEFPKSKWIEVTRLIFLAPKENIENKEEESKE